MLADRLVGRNSCDPRYHCSLAGLTTGPSRFSVSIDNGAGRISRNYQPHCLFWCKANVSSRRLIRNEQFQPSHSEHDTSPAP